MDTHDDLSMILQSWPFEPGKIKVRKVLGQDGREKIQMRIDLGILQMETFGRPDGKLYKGFPSAFEYYSAQLEDHIKIHGSSTGFTLAPEDCTELRSESLQYYYRYLSYFYLCDYPGVQKDTERNIQVFDFVRAYAAEEDDRFLLEQYRPYVIMMNTRAKAYQYLGGEDTQDAIEILITGINQIRGFFEEIEQTELIEECDEIQLLRRMAEDLLWEATGDPLSRLKEEMKQAVAREDYEQAAVLRDEIRRLEKQASG